MKEHEIKGELKEKLQELFKIFGTSIDEIEKKDKEEYQKSIDLICDISLLLHKINDTSK